MTVETAVFRRSAFLESSEAPVKSGYAGISAGMRNIRNRSSGIFEKGFCCLDAYKAEVIIKSLAGVLLKNPGKIKP